MYVLCCCHVNVFSSLELVKCWTVLEREQEQKVQRENRPSIHLSFEEGKRVKIVSVSFFSSIVVIRLVVMCFLLPS
jgi:hypothetical protein